jgi:hypothetical protein
MIRRLIIPVACTGLLLHVSVVAGTTVLVAATGRAGADLVCTCTHGADHACPMHHNPADSARCRLQSTQSDLGLALLSALGPLTLPVAAASVVADATPSRPVEYEPPLLSDATLPPDPPPPRS